MGGAGDAAREHGQGRLGALPALRAAGGGDGARRQPGLGISRPEAALHPGRRWPGRRGGGPAAARCADRARGRGADVIRAAVEAAPGTMVAAVTVVTSLGDDDLGRIGRPDWCGTRCCGWGLSRWRRRAGPGLLAARGLRGPVGGRPGCDADHARGAAARCRGRRSGAGGDAGGGPAGRRGPAGDRPPITRAPDPGAAAAAIAASLRRVSVAREPA